MLAALRRGEDTRPLGDGSFGLLPEEWLKKYGPWPRWARRRGITCASGATRSACSTRCWPRSRRRRSTTPFEPARERAARVRAASQPADPPAGFQGELRGYQRDGLGWLHFLREFGFGGCLADDMGLGKTVQVLALLEARRDARAQGTATPADRRWSWCRGRWSSTGSRRRRASRRSCASSTTPASAGAQAGANFDDFDLVLTTYGTLRRDVADLKDVALRLRHPRRGAGDQERRQRSRPRRRGCCAAEHRLALTGTPVENHLGELWSLFEFLNPGMLGTALGFRPASRRRPQRRRGDAAAAGAGACGRSSCAAPRSRSRPSCRRRPSRRSTASWKPPQRKLYDELREHYRARAARRASSATGISKSKIQVLEALLRLRQAACHPGLIDKAAVRRSRAPSSTCSLPQLDEVLEEGHKALVFSQFTSFLAIVRDRLDERRASPTSTSTARRATGRRGCERFQNDPDCQLFLISLKAGGLGLNLTAADYVFLLDPWWNPAVEAQAIDRAHRIGQTRPRLRLPPDRAGHGRGEGARAAAAASATSPTPSSPPTTA